jgi:hypothetical protein
MQPAGPLSKGGPAFFLPSVVGTFITGIAAVLSAVAMLWHGGPNRGAVPSDRFAASCRIPSPVRAQFALPLSVAGNMG